MKKTTEIQNEYKNLTEKDYNAFIKEYEADERAAIKKLCDTVRKKQDAYEREIERMKVMFTFEREYSDYQYICGVGRGQRIVGRCGSSGLWYAKTFGCDRRYIVGECQGH